MSYLNFASCIVPQKIKRYIKNTLSVKYPIIKSPNEVFEVLCKVKPDTWDKAYYAPLYGHSKEKSMEIFTPAQYAIKINDAIINADSDVVITDKGAYWEKHNEEEFMTFASPCDSNVQKYTMDDVYVVKYNKKDHISGLCLNLVGVWSFHWCHYFLHFAAKLYYAGENGLLDKDITVLIHNKCDSNLKQIISDYLAKFPNAKIKEIISKTDYLCDELICIPPASPTFNVGKFRLDYRYVHTEYSIERILRYAVDPYIAKIKDRPTKYKKIFLTRKKSRSSARTLTNYDEVHDYFMSQGFVDIEGAGMSVEEKADVFYHAEEIVGLQGASLQNLMFCNGARCLVLTNYRFVDDTCGYSEVRTRISCWVNVAGYDENGDYHSAYTIPLEKIKKVYNECIRIDNDIN